MYMNEHTWKMFFDGSYKKNGLGVRIFFVTCHGYTIPKSYKLFLYMNNIVEYETLTNGIKLATKWKIIELHIFRDSQLVFNQVNNDYQTKMKILSPIRNW